MPADLVAGLGRIRTSVRARAPSTMLLTLILSGVGRGSVIRLDWFFWADRISTTAAIPLAAVGFWIAMAQINKTKKAAEAARDATGEAREDTSRAQLIAVIGELHRIETEIERSVEVGSISVFVSWSNAWRRQAGRLRGYIDLLGHEHEDMAKSLQESITVAAVAKDQILTREPASLAKITRPLRSAITEVTSQLGPLEAVYGIGKGNG